ncbi:MAG: hypothetical protein AAGF06_08080 [Pseudomonadota bacterium]
MSSDTFEIVELENGDLALRKQDQKEGTYLIRIEFSSALTSFLSGNTFDIAQEMLKAGVHKFYQDLHDEGLESPKPVEEDSTLLH